MNQIVRWSDDPGGLSLEECARKGIEAVAGLLISRDIFDTNKYLDAMFCTCAEISHAVTGTSGNFDDHIVVSFRVVEIKEGTYPLVGRESVRMILQPISDGNISARWNAVDRALPGHSTHDGGWRVEDLDARSCACGPLTLGTIPEQEREDDEPPAFLFLKDPGAGWQIWRRFTRTRGSGETPGQEAYREESYTMVYPLLSAEMNWRFKVYDNPGGGARVEIDSGRHR